MFHYFLLEGIGIFDDGLKDVAPNLDCVLKDNLSHDEEVFLEYAGTDKEAYKNLYMQCANEILDDILKPKKKKDAKNADPSSASGKESAAKKTKKDEDGVRRCRICGCTEDDCSQCVEKIGEPCHWVKEDLCSACTGAGVIAEQIEEGAEAEKDGDSWPFDPKEADDPDPDIDVDFYDDDED